MNIVFDWSISAGECVTTILCSAWLLFIVAGLR